LPERWARGIQNRKKVAAPQTRGEWIGLAGSNRARLLTPSGEEDGMDMLGQPGRPVSPHG